MLLSSSWLNTCGLILLCLMFRRNSCTCVFSLNQTGYRKINRHVRNAFPLLTNWKSPRLTGGGKNHLTLIWYKVKWREQITKSHARADILAHVNIVLSRSPRLRLSCACLSPQRLSAFTPLPYTMIYPPRKEMKISLRTPQSDSISLCLPISKCQLISQARPPSWTPNAANCSFLCIPSAKQHINWDEEIAWSFPGLYFFSALGEIRGSLSR